MVSKAKGKEPVEVNNKKRDAVEVPPTPAKKSKATQVKVATSVEVLDEQRKLLLMVINGPAGPKRRDLNNDLCVIEWMAATPAFERLKVVMFVRTSNTSEAADRAFERLKELHEANKGMGAVVLMQCAPLNVSNHPGGHAKVSMARRFIDDGEVYDISVKPDELWNMTTVEDAWDATFLKNVFEGLGPPAKPSKWYEASARDRNAACQTVAATELCF